MLRVHRYARTLVLAACLSAAACSWQQPVPTGERPSSPIPKPSYSDAVRQAAVSAAVSQVGRPYRFGGEDPAVGFDCSGLVWFAYRSAGVTTPRTTNGLWRELDPVERGTERPGDLVFFDIDGKPQHVGLYIGDGRFVHAPSSGKSVTIAELSAPYYRSARLRGARVVH